MPPRYAYWTIIAGGLPTAFRAADRDDLLPTFQRIKEKHPDAQMKYFARGKLWESQDAARAAQQRGGDRRTRPAAGHRSGPPASGDRTGDRGARPSRTDRGGRPSLSADARRAKAEGRPDQRTRDWRPGGEHRDPRQKFVDAKKQRNAAIRKERWQRKNAGGVTDQGSGFSRGQGNREEGNRTKGTRPQGTRPQGIKPKGTRRPWERKPWARGQGTEDPQEPPKPPGPNREPSPKEEPEPTPPPRPEEPSVPAPGPPERGGHARRPFQPRGRLPKGPQR